MSRSSFARLATTTVLCLAAVAPTQGDFFWAQRTLFDDALVRADPDGTNATTIVGYPDVSEPVGLSLDPAKVIIYWAELDFGNDEIRRADADGTSVQTVVSSEHVLDPVAVAVDGLGRTVYWAELFLGDTFHRIRRANINGNNVQNVVNWPDVWDPVGVAVDPVRRTLYWAERGFGDGDHKIRRADVDGLNIATIAQWPDVVEPVAIAINPITGTIYWGGKSNPVLTDDCIKSTDPAGSSVQTILCGSPSVVNPTGLAVDAQAGKLYWVEITELPDPPFRADRLVRANLDGTNVEPLLTYPQILDPIGVTTPIDATLIGIPAVSTWTLVAMATLLIAAGAVILGNRRRGRVRDTSGGGLS